MTESDQNRHFQSLLALGLLYLLKYILEINLLTATIIDAAGLLVTVDRFEERSTNAWLISPSMNSLTQLGVQFTLPNALFIIVGTKFLQLFCGFKNLPLLANVFYSLNFDTGF